MISDTMFKLALKAASVELTKLAKISEVLLNARQCPVEFNRRGLSSNNKIIFYDRNNYIVNVIVNKYVIVML